LLLSGVQAGELSNLKLRAAPRCKYWQKPWTRLYGCCLIFCPFNCISQRSFRWRVRFKQLVCELWSVLALAITQCLCGSCLVWQRPTFATPSVLWWKQKNVLEQLFAPKTIAESHFVLLNSDCGTSSTTATTTSNPLATLTQLIGSCETMEATYCMGTDVDVCRMFDQYLYKVSGESVTLLMILFGT